MRSRKRRLCRETICHCVLGFVALGLFVLFHVLTYTPGWSDENIHIYTASRIADGLMPYRDVPSARPPLALLPLAACMGLGLSPLFAARAVLAGAQLLTGFILGWSARRLWGPVAGTAAFVLYLAVVPPKHVFTGIDTVVLGTTACALLVLFHRPGLAGLVGGLAIVSGQHAVVVVCSSWAMGSILGRGGWWRFGAGLFLSLGIIFGTMFALSGPAMWEQLVGHHLYHVTGEHASTVELGKDLRIWLPEHLPILFFGTAAVFLPSTALVTFRNTRVSSIGPAHLAVLLAVLHVGTVTVMNGGHILYMQPAVPLLCLAAAGAVGSLASTWRRAPRNSIGRMQRRLVLAVACSATFASAVGWMGVAGIRSERDSEKYSALPILAHRKMAELQNMVAADHIAEHLSEHSSIQDTVFGHATLVSHVATYSDRRVSAELADLAPRWFEMGVLDREDVVRSIEGDQVEYFVTPRWFYIRDSFFREYLKKCYEVPEVFPREKGPGRGIPDLLLFRRSGVPRPCVPES